MTRCTVCGRPSRRAESIAAGIGPWCRHTQELNVVEMSASEAVLLEDERRALSIGRNHSCLFPASPAIAQLRLDLLEAMEEREGLPHDQRRKRVDAEILRTVERAEAYGGATLWTLAMLAVIGIEHLTQVKEDFDAAATA